MGPAGGHQSGMAGGGSGPTPFGYGENQYYRNAVKNSRIYNCRNPWFRQFWEQHFKCRFNSSSSSGPSSLSSNTSLPECRGGDKLTYYEQEGLVPFVGEFYSSASCPASISGLTSNTAQFAVRLQLVPRQWTVASCRQNEYVLTAGN